MHRQVEDINAAQNPKKDGDKSAVAILQGCTTIGLRISGHRAAGIFIDFTEEHKSLGTYSTSASQRHANIRESRGPSLGVIQIKNPLRIDLRKRLRRQERMRPRRRVENGQKYPKAQRKGHNYFFLTNRSLVSPSNHA